MREDRNIDSIIHLKCPQKDIDLNIPILSKGFYIPRDPFSCKVFSLHKGVINLLVSETDILISLIEDRRNMTAMSLLVPDLFSSTADLLNQDCTISIIGKCEDWKGEPPRICKRNNSLKENLPKILRLLDDGLGFISLLTGNCTDSFQIKGKSILDHSITMEQGKIRGLEALVGLGRGMTPSGDDFVTGVLLAAHSLNLQKMIEREAIQSKSASTTYGGRTLLTLALKGSFPSYLITFLEEYLNADTDESMVGAFEKAALHGSTSGRDSLAGFLWFLNEAI